MIAATSSARADELASSAARPDYEATEKLLMFDARRRLEARGLTIDGTYSIDLFAAPQLDRPLTLGGLFTFEVDAFADRFHLSAFAIHGGGPTNELLDVHGTSGNTAPPDVRLFEAWWDQPIGPVDLRAGLLSVDQEFVIANHSQLLLGATFGITTQVSVNLLGPVYPIASPGVSARLDGRWFNARLAAYDGTLANWHGIPRALAGDQLVIGELGTHDLTIGAWHHTDPAKGDAVYAMLDSQLDAGLGFFARGGYSPNGVVGTYLDAGVRATPHRLRPQDLLSAGIAFAFAGDAGAQTIAETSYELQIRWLSIQPSFQLVFLPERTVAVFATRLTVTL